MSQAGELPGARRGGRQRVGRCVACKGRFDVNVNPRITRPRVTCRPECAEAAGRNQKLNGDRHERNLRRQRERYASDPEFRERRNGYRRGWAGRNPERVIRYRQRYAERAKAGAGS